ncbi:MAG: hypothetical protein RMM31_05685 [Anaerolineae bacterium]|nr:hypothetical protein [Thermoflexales bacterium]MDW8395714.1 hypothetical protein [Anaerolineae bacterium]
MDYGLVLSQALRLTIKYPALWVLGFLAALSDTSVDLLRIDLEALPDPGAGSTSAEAAALLEALLLEIANLLPLTLPFSIVGLFGFGGLIVAVDQVVREGRVELGSALWRTLKRFHHLLLVFVLFGLGLTGLYLAFAALPTIVLYKGVGEGSASLATAFETLLASGLACIGLLCVVLPYVVLSAGIQTFGQRAILLEGYGAFRGILRAVKMMFSHFGIVAVVALMVLTLTFIIGLLLGLVTEVPLTLLVAVLNLEGSTLSEPVRTVGRALFAAVFTAYYSTVWTLTYQELVKLEARRAALFERRWIPHSL